MKPRRTVVVASVLALFACAIGAACTFPDVAFAPAGGSGGEAGSDGNAEGSADSSSGDDGSSDAALVEAATRPDAAKVDASGCTTCDCDMDGYKERDGGCEGGPGPVFDCDDTDDFINPKQTFVDDFHWTSVHPTPFDWNCDGKVEKAYPTNLKCGGTVLTGCTGGQGFLGDPSCGTGADYYECKGVNGLCAAAKSGLPRNQLCR